MEGRPRDQIPDEKYTQPQFKGKFVKGEREMIGISIKQTLTFTFTLTI